MGERRQNRDLPPRSDRQILAHDQAVYLLSEIAQTRVRVTTDNRMTLRRLCREDLCLAGFGFGTVPTLLPRGERIVTAARGEIAPPLDN